MRWGGGGGGGQREQLIYTRDWDGIWDFCHR